MSNSFHDYLERYQHRVNNSLNAKISTFSPTASPRLIEAMRYSLLANGKRIRPVLAYASAGAVGEITDGADSVAAALECIHTYSLIHDDLPAMDDDDLRRGTPTCHIAFDEATAILAGDALQTLAFQIIADCPTLSANAKIKSVSVLAKTSGASGMVAGQAIDLAAVNQQISLPELEQMHQYKTGALIKASVVMGAIATEEATEKQLSALEEYAHAIGLAFQVQDDILDVVGDADAIGKQTGADASHNKPTYVSLLGLDQAKKRAQELYNQAIGIIDSHFDQRAQPLKDLANFIVNRQS
ncbi:MAG: (2E,6E)-farnesyl diphosphate synthase [Cellvibrionaceae bacterium]